MNQQNDLQRNETSQQQQPIYQSQQSMPAAQSHSSHSPIHPRGALRSDDANMSSPAMQSNYNNDNNFAYNTNRRSDAASIDNRSSYDNRMNDSANPQKFKDEQEYKQQYQQQQQQQQQQHQQSSIQQLDVDDERIADHKQQPRATIQPQQYQQRTNDYYDDRRSFNNQWQQQPHPQQQSGFSDDDQRYNSSMQYQSNQDYQRFNPQFQPNMQSRSNYMNDPRDPPPPQHQSFGDEDERRPIDRDCIFG
jgi:hypothetical protein